MLLQYHIDILMNALYILHPANNNIHDDLLLYTNSQTAIQYNDDQKQINKQFQSNPNSNTIHIDNTAITKLFTGLIYPDAPCGYFYIINNQIHPDLRICRLDKMEIGKRHGEVTSQMYESHNQYYAINHSMAIDSTYSNREIQLLIMRRILALANYFIDYNDYAFLGYIIHIVHDSWPNGHTIREFVDIDNLNNNIKKYNFDDITQYLNSTIPCPNHPNHNINSKKYMLDIDHMNMFLHELLNDSDIRVSLLKLLDKYNHAIFLNKLLYIFIINSTEYDEFTKSKQSGPFDQAVTKFITKLFTQPIFKSFIDHDVKIDKLTDIINNQYIAHGNINISHIEFTNRTFDFFKPNISYESTPHELRRIYKLLMNNLFTYQQLDALKLSQISPISSSPASPALPALPATPILKGGTDNPQRIEIIGFRNFNNEDHNVHIFSDCKQVILKVDSMLYNYAIIDTVNVINIMISNNDKKTKITNLFNYLINNTYHISESNLDMKLDGKLFNSIYKKHDERYMKSVSNIGIELAECMTGQVEVLGSNDKIGLMDVKRYFDKMDKIIA